MAELGDSDSGSGRVVKQGVSSPIVVVAMRENENEKVGGQTTVVVVLNSLPVGRIMAEH